MLSIVVACGFLYAVLLGIEIASSNLGRRPWTHLRLLFGATGVIVLTLSAANWTGLIPASLFRAPQAIDAQLSTSASVKTGWFASSGLNIPPGTENGLHPEDTTPPGWQHPDIFRYIHYYSALYEVDPLLVKAVIRAESAFDPFAASNKGAMGLMQINRITAKHLGMSNPFDIRENIEGGTRYLKTLLKKHYWDLHLALASYNAGPAAVSRYKGIPPFRETRRYVWKVISEYRKLKRLDKVFRESQFQASRPDRAATPRRPQALKSPAGSNQAAG